MLSSFRLDVFGDMEMNEWKWFLISFFRLYWKLDWDFGLGFGFVLYRQFFRLLWFLRIQLKGDDDVIFIRDDVIIGFSVIKFNIFLWKNE